MTVIRPNSISGINSITANGGDINLFRADGTKADIPIVNNITGVGATFTGQTVVGLGVTSNNTGVDVTGIVTSSTLKSNFFDASGNRSLNIPSGPTSDRSGVATRGNLRYNTETTSVEFYDGNNWKNIGSSQPLVNNITPTTFDGTAGTIITIIGKDFVTGANVHFVSSVNGSSTAAGVVTFTNSTTLTAVLPALTTAGEPYGVKVTNPDGGQTLLEAALDAGSGPAWTTGRQ